MGDIERGESYVCDDDDGRPVAAFCLAPSPEPTYAAIYGGAWLNDDPYHVIHRLASDGTTHGVGRAVIDWCKKRHQNLRIDTHADNRVMQSVAERCGFARCGIIYVANGSPRIAYQLKPRKG